MFIGAPGLLLLARPLAAERESKGKGGELSRRVLVVRRHVLQTEEQQTREPHRARVYPRHPENTERRGRTVPLRGLLLELIFYRDRVSSGAQRGSAWFFA
ncbi:unnamed protein product [Arctogadus glacialis]